MKIQIDIIKMKSTRDLIDEVLTQTYSSIFDLVCEPSRRDAPYQLMVAVDSASRLVTYRSTCDGAREWAMWWC
jgi:hypothetical protein